MVRGGSFAHTQIYLALAEGSRLIRVGFCHASDLSNSYAESRPTDVFAFGAGVYPTQKGGVISQLYVLVAYGFYTCLPSGKHTKNHGISQSLRTVNQLFLWAMASANCKKLPEGGLLTYLGCTRQVRLDTGVRIRLDRSCLAKLVVCNSKNNIGFMVDTLWLFNIAMENHHLQ